MHEFHILSLILHFDEFNCVTSYFRSHGVTILYRHREKDMMSVCTMVQCRT